MRRLTIRDGSVPADAHCLLRYAEFAASSGASFWPLRGPACVEAKLAFPEWLVEIMVTAAV